MKIAVDLIDSLSTDFDHSKYHDQYRKRVTEMIKHKAKGEEIVTQPQIEAKQALFFGETPVNPKACPFMNKIQAGSCAQYHLNQPLSYYKTIHFWKTPVPDCGNGQKNCMDYRKWVNAWNQAVS